MRNILTIVKKELLRFFKDRRMVLSVLLPGIMIFIMYSVMGGAISDVAGGDKDYKPKAYVKNMPANAMITGFFEGGCDLLADTDDGEAIKKKIIDKKADVYVVFPENFSELGVGGDNVPNVEVYYNSSDSNSQAAYTAVVAMLNAYESSISNVFDVNKGETKYDLASEKDLTGMIFSMIMPMLLVMFVFVGAMSVAPESIAGEKERGTIATLLVTPIKRSHLALGKIIALSVIAMISGISSFIGTALSLPKLVGGMGVSAASYVFGDYALLLCLILSTVFISIAVIAIISAAAKSVKEAAAYVSPLMIIIVLIGVTGMFGSGAAKSPFLYLIPFYNSVQAMTGIFSFAASPINIVITVVSNIVYTALLVFALSKMFSSEKIMFSK